MNLKSAFPNFDQSLLDHLSKSGDVMHFSSEELLIRPGQYLKGTILIIEGIVKLYLEGSKGEEVFLYFLTKGDACALSIICGSSTNFDIKAKAMTDIKALIISPEDMDGLIRNHPKWYYFLLETYQTRLRELLNTLNQIAFHSMEEKLHFYLKRQFEALKSNTISITHQEIASDLNSSREVISRLLKKMEAEKLILLNRNEITNVALEIS
jgi:CRP/FNR family transcriptional regulator